MGKLVSIYKYSKSFLSLIAGVFAHLFIPIAQYIIIIPKSAYYTIDVAIYVAVFSAILTYIEDKIKARQTKIDVLFYNTGKNTFSGECLLPLNTSKYGKLSIQIIVSGLIKANNKAVLEIKFPAFVTVQSRKKIFGGSLKSNTVTVRLSDLVKQNAENDFNTTLNFSLMQSSEFNGSMNSNVVGRLHQSSFMTVLNNKNRLKINVVPGDDDDGISD